MTRSINLVSQKILSILVNVPDRYVEATYALRDETDREWEVKTLIFWETIPDPGIDLATGDPIPVPDNWQQLPAKYVDGLVNMYQDLSAFIDNFEQLV